MRLVPEEKDKPKEIHYKKKEYIQNKENKDNKDNKDNKENNNLNTYKNVTVTTTTKK